MNYSVFSAITLIICFIYKYFTYRKKLHNNNNKDNDRLTAFDPGQPG